MPSFGRSLRAFTHCVSDGTLLAAILAIALFLFAPAFAETRPPAAKCTSELTVAQDGTGQFSTIQAALDSVPRDHRGWSCILIRNGTYREKLYVNVSRVALAGEHRDRTRILFAELRKNWRKDHPNDWGAAVVNIGDDVSDLVLANLTVHNNYGSLHGDNDHQFAIRSGGNSTRIALLHTAVIADGGDTLSLWNAETGMYFHDDCYFEGYVDFVCPRGDSYISNSTFYAHPSPAAIWHDGSRNRSHKLVIRHSWFDGVPGFPLGRNHRDGQFFLIDNSFSANMADQPIYRAPAPQPLQWGPRYYYWNNHRNDGDFGWFADNLCKADNAPAPNSVNASWTFAGEWDPEASLPPVLPFASTPKPEHGSTMIPADRIELRWIPARHALRQLVYFGSSESPRLRKQQVHSSYRTGRLKPGTSYSWRVDSITPNGVARGPIWTFTTKGAVPASASSVSSPTVTQGHKARIVLVGDSTVTDESGWGKGFGEFFGDNVQYINHAKGGRSSKSYMNEGLWARALDERPDFVLIQFGHNDMPGKGFDRETGPHEQYLEFLSRYIREARGIGAVPVIVTPISRRHFDAAGELNDDLWEYAQAARQLAVEQHVALIDLHALSTRLLRAMGPSAVDKFGTRKADGSIDYTHLNEYASEVFGQMVAEELTKVTPALKPSRKCHSEPRSHPLLTNTDQS